LEQPLRKTIWQFLKKLKTELPYGPAIPPLGAYPKEVNPVYRRGDFLLILTPSESSLSEDVGGISGVERAAEACVDLLNI